jgi:hypothetical protein
MTKIETRLVRTDFSNPSSVQCKVLSDGSEIGTLKSTDYNDESNCLLLPKSQTIKILVFLDDSLAGSVSFSSSLLTDSGCVWLPVLPEGSDDLIEELPEELSSPKILMYFEKKLEEVPEQVDELVSLREELKIVSKDYQDLVKNSKLREIALIKNLEEKEIEIQEYIQQLSRSQSRIFTLLAEKKHLNDNLIRIKQDLNFNLVNELKEELEISRQELFKCEKRNENLLLKLEEVHGEWNFIEEESKHLKESELLSQINQMKNELEIKNKEISLLKTQNSGVLNEITNKHSKDELNETVKHAKPAKIKDSGNTSVCLEHLHNSLVVDEDSILQHSFFVNSSKATYSSLKENLRKTPEPDRARLPKGGTLGSLSKSKFLPVGTSRRANHSAERRGK